MLQPIETPTRPSLPHERYPDAELPTDDGTLEAQPPRLTSLQEVPEPDPMMLWIIVTATCTGLLAAALMLVQAGGFGQDQVQQPWMVLRIQHDALTTPANDELEAEALVTSQAFLAAETDSPWRTVIEENHVRLMDSEGPRR